MSAGAGWAVLVAGGTGRRVGGDEPKQFCVLAGQTVLERSLRALDSISLAGVVVVAAAGYDERTRSVVDAVPRRAPRLVVVTGGPTRQESVACGCAAVPASAPWIMVHDAARPFVSTDLLERLLAGLERADAVIPGVPATNTLKRVDARGFVTETLERSAVVEVQTPQLFRAALLRDAHDRARALSVTGTDCAVLVERLGAPVLVVAGDPWNVKITTRHDIVVAECLATHRE